MSLLPLLTLAASLVHPAAASPQPSTDPTVTAVIWHEVEDFDAWKAGYDAFADQRTDKGVIADSIHLDTANPDRVVAVHRFATPDLARAFLVDPDVNAAMAPLGITSKPQVLIGADVLPIDSTPEPGEATLVIWHDVADFDAWKRGYDNLAHVREDLGVLQDSVHRDLDRPQRVIATHRFATAQDARRFLHDRRLEDAMLALGITSPPRALLTVDVP